MAAQAAASLCNEVKEIQRIAVFLVDKDIYK